MTPELIAEWIVTLLPSLIAVCTAVFTFIKMVHEFKKTRQEVVDLKCIEDLKTELRGVAAENRELKAKLNETLTKIDHIKREDNGKKVRRN